MVQRHKRRLAPLNSDEMTRDHVLFQLVALPKPYPGNVWELSTDTSCSDTDANIAGESGEKNEVTL